MSRFLGPIHFWLFNKIVLFEELERAVIREVEGKLNIDLKATVESINERYGYPMEDKPLEELIDEGNIHGWLQEKISNAELRQADLITNLIKENDKAYDVIKEVYSMQGREAGRNARDKYDPLTASEVYKALNDYILDGMPCDHVNTITVNKEKNLEWKVAQCIHKKYWIKVSGDENVFYELRKGWVSEFVSNISDEFKYEFEIGSNGVLSGKITAK